MILRAFGDARKFPERFINATNLARGIKMNCAFVVIRKAHEGTVDLHAKIKPPSSLSQGNECPFFLSVLPRIRHRL